MSYLLACAEMDLFHVISRFGLEGKGFNFTAGHIFFSCFPRGQRSKWTWVVRTPFHWGTFNLTWRGFFQLGHGPGPIFGEVQPKDGLSA